MRVLARDVRLIHKGYVRSEESSESVRSAESAGYVSLRKRKHTEDDGWVRKTEVFLPYMAIKRGLPSVG